jgi:hydrogenase/urease accessory protein HupE
MTLRLVSLALLLSASPALAHPGHGAAGWLHGLAAEHLAPFALAALVACALAARRRVARERSRSH